MVALNASILPGFPPRAKSELKTSRYGMLLAVCCNRLFVVVPMAASATTAAMETIAMMNVYSINVAASRLCNRLSLFDAVRFIVSAYLTNK